MVSAIHHSLPTHSTHLPISPLQTDDRGWTNFERAEGQLIKPDSFCVDIGLFTVEKACEAAAGKRWRESDEEWNKRLASLRIGEVPFAKKSVKELAMQGSYRFPTARGLLGSLAGSGRAPPLSPWSCTVVASSAWRSPAVRGLGRPWTAIRRAMQSGSEDGFERLGRLPGKTHK